MFNKVWTQRTAMMQRGLPLLLRRPLSRLRCHAAQAHDRADQICALAAVDKLQLASHASHLARPNPTVHEECHKGGHENEAGGQGAWGKQHVVVRCCITVRCMHVSCNVRDLRVVRAPPSSVLCCVRPGSNTVTQWLFISFHD